MKDKDFERRAENLKTFKNLVEFLQDFKEEDDDTGTDEMAIKMEELFEQKFQKLKKSGILDR